jgi:hypothetical protein
MDLIRTLNPNSVLDIGVGFGKYGVLCREYLEIWDKRLEQGKEKYSEFLRRIDGIEVFEEYLTPLHKFVYNNIYIGNATKIIDEIDFNYDLVLLIGVLEHLTEAEGEQLLRKLLAKSKGVLISTDKDIGNKRATFDNPYEVHKSQWSKKKLSKLGSSFFIRDPTDFIVYISKKEDIKKIKRKMFIKKTKLFFASIPFVLKVYHLIFKAKK